MNKLNHSRKKNLQQIQPKLSQKWRFAINEYKTKSSLYQTKQSTNQQISTQISIKKLLKIADFYKLKVLPIMQMNEQRKLSMIQNIAVPSTFKIKHIRDFYNNAQNELFRFPLPSINDLSIDTKARRLVSSRDSRSRPHNQSHSSLRNYRSSQYEIPLKNGNSGSPLQKYISSVSAQMGIPVPFLTPPGYKQQPPLLDHEIEKLNSKSLPKNLMIWYYHIF